MSISQYAPLKIGADVINNNSNSSEINMSFNKEKSNTFPSFLSMILEHITENAEIGFLALESHNIVYSNSYINNLLGYQDNEMPGKNIQTILSTESFNILSEYLTLLPSEDRKISKLQIPIQHKNNHEIWLEIKGSIKTYEGKPYIILSLSDITNKKMAEKALVDSEAKNRSMINAIPDMFFVYNKEGIITDCISSGQEILKEDPKDFIGKSLDSIYPEKIKKLILQNIKEVIRKKKLKLIEYEIQRKESKRFYEGRMVPYQDESVLFLVRNITLRKKVESKLADSESKLKQMNKEKDKFFSIIAHDLKNPFSSISGFSKLLQMNINKYDNAKINEILEMMITSSRSGYNLLENLLEWSRSQSGKLTFRKENLDLCKIINEAIHSLSASAHHKKIVISTNLEKGLSPIGDANMISTVIRNLVSNAIKFTPENGSIIVATLCKDNIVEVSVKDTGIGITKKQLNNLFKLDTGYSTRGTIGEKGTGLGLIICKEFVEKHHGNIYVKSQNGEGSEFTFTIPIN